MVGQGRLRSEDLVWQVRAGEWPDDDAVFRRGASRVEGRAARRALHRANGRYVGNTGSVFGLELTDPCANSFYPFYCF